MKDKYILFLIGIILLGSILRLVFLGENPVGFHRDEAFFGYNAYSLLKTGNEMTGSTLPIHLDSFLHSPGGYSYLAIPAISIFGLTAFATRLPAALFGIMTLPLVYFFVLKLFETIKDKKMIALLSTLFLAISPWHINLSRVATENVIVVFLITLGLLFYMLSLSKKPLLYLFFAFFSFLLSLGMYQAPRAFLPLFIPLLLLLTFKSSNKKHLIISLILFGLLIVIPVLLILFSPTLSERIQMLSIFKHPETQLVLDEQFREDGVANIPSIIARLFHNKLINYAGFFIDNYLKHFSFDFFFTDSALPIRYKIPMMGLVHLLEGISLVIGLLLLLVRRFKYGLLLVGWFFLAPIGSALTFDDTPNMQRTLLIFPALSIIAAYGATTVIKKVKQFRGYSLFMAGIVAITLFSFFYYLHQYYIHGKYHEPWYRNEGYTQLMQEVEERKNNYDQVIMTEWQSDPYIFYLFNTKYDPKVIQKLYKEEGPIYKKQIDSITFVGVDCPLKEKSIINSAGVEEIVVDGKENILYINHGECKIPQKNVKVLSTIRRSDNTAVFTILEYTN